MGILNWSWNPCWTYKVVWAPQKLVGFCRLHPKPPAEHWLNTLIKKNDWLIFTIWRLLTPKWKFSSSELPGPDVRQRVDVAGVLGCWPRSQRGAPKGLDHPRVALFQLLKLSYHHAKTKESVQADMPQKSWKYTWSRLIRRKTMNKNQQCFLGAQNSGWSLHQEPCVYPRFYEIPRLIHSAIVRSQPPIYGHGSCRMVWNHVN